LKRYNNSINYGSKGEYGAANGLVIDSGHLSLTENNKSFIRIHFGLIIKLKWFFAAVSYKRSGWQEFSWVTVW